MRIPITQKAKLRLKAVRWLTQFSVLASVLDPDTATGQGSQEKATDVSTGVS